MGRERRHPKAQPNERSAAAARDYLALLRRTGLNDDGGLLVAAQHKGVALAQSTLSRVRTAAMPNGPTAETMQAIATVAGETVEVAFPTVYSTGNAVQDRLRQAVAKLSPKDAAALLAIAEGMLE